MNKLVHDPVHDPVNEPVNDVDLVNYSPIILTLISSYVLIQKSKLLFIYLSGYILNILINIGLKCIIKWPKPNENIDVFLAEKRLHKYISYDRYGMPSGHAQSMFYTLSFMYATKLVNIQLFLFFICITLIILYLSYQSYHSIEQIIVGSILGIVFGYSCFYYSQIIIRGPIQIKSNIEDYLGKEDYLG